MLVGIVPFVFEALVFESPVPLVEVFDIEPLVKVLGNLILVENALLLVLLLSLHFCRHG